MGKPDALSRKADHGSWQGDNNNLTLLTPELFQIHALAGVRLEGDEHNILQESVPKNANETESSVLFGVFVYAKYLRKIRPCLIAIISWIVGWIVARL
jgi:hypothetical protein